MTRFCDGHAFGCGCTDRCTKTVDLGSFTKRRDDINAKRQKFITDLPAKSALGWAAILFVCVGFWTAVGVGVSELERQALVNQEVSKWK